MNLPRPAILLGSLFVIAAGGLLFIGSPVSNHSPPPPPKAGSATPRPSSVSGGNFTLTSVDMVLPDDTGLFPDGPNADVINSNCRACHSASMALYQPKLSADQWRKEVEKMRNTFGAPASEDDVPAIVAYLTAMSDKLPDAAKAAE